VLDAPAPAILTGVRHRGLALAERRLLLVGLDVAAVSAAFIAAFNLHTSSARDVGFYVPRLGTLITVAVYLACAQMAEAYDLRAAATVVGNLRAAGTALACSFVGLLGVFFLIPYRITRPTLILWLPLAAVAVIIGRVLCRRLLVADQLAGRIALVMPREALEDVWPEVRSHIGGLYRIAGVVDPTRPDCAERLRTLVATRGVDQIVLGVGDDVPRELFRGVLGCHDAGVRVRSVADLYEELTDRLLLDQLGPAWLMSLRMRSETSRLYSTFKRALDVATAVLGLALLAVILPAVTALVVADDPGPIFHRQTRVGKYGSKFTLYKLRTMREATGDRGTSLPWTEHGDPRITRIGTLLRRLHLDELPQAWSVLCGHMSLIGPRPEQPHYVEEMRQHIDLYNTRLTVRPGLTGWAQVRYGYGSGVEGTRMKLAYDLYYVKHQSVSLDLLIMARTVLAVLRLTGR
jgi:exopolysaccharide biosynthesis polyprenyl glycosylphosphotransferase